MARSAQVLPLIRTLLQYTGRVRRELVIELVGILFEVTPVKTGHARSNWIPRLGHPFRGVAGSRERVDYGPQERGLREIQDEPLTSKRVANLGNNVKYLPRLNTGWSAQAPAAFIQGAIAQAKVNVRIRIGRLKRAA